MTADDDFIASIAPNVLVVLAKNRFFEALDDELCPAEVSVPRRGCDGTHAVSGMILLRMGFDRLDTEEVLQVLARGEDAPDHGGEVWVNPKTDTNRPKYHGQNEPCTLRQGARTSIEIAPDVETILRRRRANAEGVDSDIFGSLAD